MRPERSRKNFGCVKTIHVENKLNNVFQDHFKEKDIEIQPEVLNPENYPHILPPDEVQINSNVPEVTEVKYVLKEFKNGKRLGTDLLHPEHLKYNNSNRFILYLMLLLTTIWTTFCIPSSWIISSITCLFKNKESWSEAGHHRGLSIMSACSKDLASLVIYIIINAYTS